MAFSGLLYWLIRRQNNISALLPPKAIRRGISQAGVNFIKKEEGLRLDQYADAAGFPTIGYGHKIEPPEFFPPAITEPEAEKLLRRDIARFESSVNDLVKVPVTQNMYDALISLAFNIGIGALARSTTIRLLNKGDYKGAADAILLWKFANKQPILLARRERERTVFLS